MEWLKLYVENFTDSKKFIILYKRGDKNGKHKNL